MEEKVLEQFPFSFLYLYIFFLSKQLVLKASTFC